MLRFRTDTEDWRARCATQIDQAVQEAGVVTRDHDDVIDREWFDPWVDNFSDEVIWRLREQGIEHTFSSRLSPQQTFGTHAERAAFRAAVDHVAALPQVVRGVAAAAGGLAEFHQEGQRLAKEDARRLTRADVERANARYDAVMAELHRLDVDEAAADDRLREVWVPIVELLRLNDPPAHREDEVESLGPDCVGALPTGELVVWDHCPNDQTRFRILDHKE